VRSANLAGAVLLFNAAYFRILMLGKKYNLIQFKAKCSEENWKLARVPSRPVPFDTFEQSKDSKGRVLHGPCRGASIPRPLPSRVRVAALSNCSPGIFTATHFDVLVVFVEQLEPVALLV
jgi:hypothetical protein